MLSTNAHPAAVAYSMQFVRLWRKDGVSRLDAPALRMYRLYRSCGQHPAMALNNALAAVAIPAFS